MEVLIGIFAFLLILCIVMKIYTKSSTYKEAIKTIEDPLVENLNRYIKETTSIENTVKSLTETDSEKTIEQQLYSLHMDARDKHCAAKNSFLSKEGITRTADSYSNLSLCGVTNKNFYYCIGDSLPEIPDKAVSSKYTEMLPLIEKEKMVLRGFYPHCGARIEPLLGDIKKAVKAYSMAQKGIVIVPHKILLDDIQYFKIDGTVQYVSEVSGGGVNMQGAIAGAVLAGGAAAIIGSRIGTETKTDIVEKDSRKIVLAYKVNNEMRMLNIESYNPQKTIEALRMLIPQKEEAIVMLKNTTKESSNTVAQISNADELKKFKELLDMGVITKEEFDAKKKQLLGL